MPNCSIDLACEGSSNSSALLPSSVTPPINNFSICSFPVCGNGKCTPIGSSLLAYDCKCDPGSLNIFNSSNGYCLEQCSLGAGCSNLNITLGGSPSPPPPPSSPQSQNSNQALVCENVDCGKGQCKESSSLPFYECQCDKGWKSPLGLSWIPCVMPNCSIDLDCAGALAPSAPSPSSVSPPSKNFSICSLPVCGNGNCIPGDSSLSTYQCKCNPGSLNIFNSSSGYCLEQCSLGAGCSSLNITLGSSTSLAPSPQSQNSNQGSKQKHMLNFMIICGEIVLQMILLL